MRGHFFSKLAILQKNFYISLGVFIQKLKYVPNNKLVSHYFLLFIILLTTFFTMLVAIIFIIPSMYFIVLPGVITYINDFYYFLSLLFNSANASIFSNDYSNFKFDIDTTTNTDGEDLLSYLNDFTEISLQERSYFFD